MRKFIGIPLLLLATISSRAQQLPVSSPKTFQLRTAAAADSGILRLEGFVDARNSLSRKLNDIDRTFQPLRYLEIANLGQKTIVSPRLTVNGEKNWYTRQDLKNEIYGSTTDAFWKTYQLWKYIIDNRVHGTPAEAGNEVHDPIKLIAQYGYGICDDATMGILQITGVDSSKLRDIRGHVIPSLAIDGYPDIIFDGDIEVYYRSLDNKSIVGYNSLVEDRYLIARTHNYGVGYRRDLKTDRWLSTFYGNDVVQNVAPIVALPPFAIDFTLRPGERIILKDSLNKPILWHEYQLPVSVNMARIGNGRKIFETNFTGLDLSQVFTNRNNLEKGTGAGTANLKLSPGKTIGSVVYAFASPFVLLGGNLHLKSAAGATTDSVNVFFSYNGLTWQKAGSTGENSALSIDLTEWFKPTTSLAKYNGFLKFEVASPGMNPAFGIDSLAIESIFQIGEFFTPELLRGDNIFRYSDKSTERDVLISASFVEDHANHPPGFPVNATYPSDQSETDRLQFTFAWTPAVDPDGDAIVDYEFELSDRPDMRMPFSPNFHRYTAQEGNSQLAGYHIPWPGLLNDGQTYYWRVKAKDIKGVWGDWSPVWSFTAKGPRPPVQLRASLLVSDTLQLSWRHDPTGPRPAGYAVYGSNESGGFVPDQASLVMIVPGNNCKIPLNEVKAFYRVAAIAATSDTSRPTSVFQITWPLPENRKLTADRILNSPILLPDIYTVNYNDVSGQIDSMGVTTKVNVLSKPSWITFDEAGMRLTGELNEADIDSFLTKRSYNTVQLEVETYIDGRLLRKENRTFRIYPDFNITPQLQPIDRLYGFKGVEVKDTFVVSNFTQLLNNNPVLELVAGPDWLTVTLAKDSIFLSGIPPIPDLLQNITLAAVDGEDSLHFNIPVSIYPVPEIALQATKSSPYCPEEPIGVSVASNLAAPWKYRIAYNGDTTLHDANLISGNGFVLAQRDETTIHLVDVTVGNKTYIPAGVEAQFEKYIPIAPAITSQLDTVILMENFLFAPVVTDPDFAECGDVHTFELLNAPAWLQIDPQTGNVTGTPDEFGQTEFTIQVKDRYGLTQGKSFQLYVSDIPEITSLPDSVVFVNKAYAYQLVVENESISATADGSGGIVASVTELPGWLKFDETTGEITGTPGEYDLGNYTFHIRVENAKGYFVEKVVNLIVKAPDEAPIVIKTDLYPNPVDAMLNIDAAFSESANVSVLLFDIQGRLSLQLFNGRVEWGKRNFRFPIHHSLAPGMYIVQLIVSSNLEHNDRKVEKIVFKIVKQ